MIYEAASAASAKEGEAAAAAAAASKRGRQTSVAHSARVGGVGGVASGGTGVESAARRSGHGLEHVLRVLGDLAAARLARKVGERAAAAAAAEAARLLLLHHGERLPLVAHGGLGVSGALRDWDGLVQDCLRR